MPELWLADGPAGLRNHAVDVTDVFDKKMAALRSHSSQAGATSGELEDAMRQGLAATAAKFGLGEGRLAECFQVVDTSR